MAPLIDAKSPLAAIQTGQTFPINKQLRNLSTVECVRG
jgi:hypothetical protein